MQWLFLRPSPIESQRTLCKNGLQSWNSTFLLYTVFETLQSTEHPKSL